MGLARRLGVLLAALVITGDAKTSGGKETGGTPTNPSTPPPTPASTWPTTVTTPPPTPTPPTQVPPTVAPPTKAPPKSIDECQTTGTAFCAQKHQTCFDLDVATPGRWYCACIKPAVGNFAFAAHADCVLPPTVVPLTPTPPSVVPPSAAPPSVVPPTVAPPTVALLTVAPPTVALLTVVPPSTDGVLPSAMSQRTPTPRTYPPRPEASERDTSAEQRLLEIMLCAAVCVCLCAVAGAWWCRQARRERAHAMRIEAQIVPPARGGKTGDEGSGTLLEVEEVPPVEEATEVFEAPESVRRAKPAALKKSSRVLEESTADASQLCAYIDSCADLSLTQGMSFSSLRAQKWCGVAGRTKPTGPLAAYDFDTSLRSFRCASPPRKDTMRSASPPRKDTMRSASPPRKDTMRSASPPRKDTMRKDNRSMASMAAMTWSRGRGEASMTNASMLLSQSYRPTRCRQSAPGDASDSLR